MKKIASGIFIYLAVSGLYAQKVTIREVTKDKDQFIIEYKISKARSYQIFHTDLLAHIEDDTSLTTPLKSVQGDIGPNLRRGRKTVTWNYFEEKPFIEKDLNMKKNIEFEIKATVTEEKSSYFFISYSGNEITPFGIRFGGLGKTSVFVEARANSMAWNSTPNLTFNGKSITNYKLENQYYLFNENTEYRNYSGSFGLTIQLFRNLFLYIGAGYGVCQYLYQVDNYEYGVDQPLTHSWVISYEHSVEGIEANGGVTVRFLKHLIISAGYATIFNLNESYKGGYYGHYTLGLGACF